MTRPYVAFARKHHPQGWAHPCWAGTTRSEGNLRATDVCRHQHTSEADALRCAGHLADLSPAALLERLGSGVEDDAALNVECPTDLGEGGPRDLATSMEVVEHGRLS